MAAQVDGGSSVLLIKKRSCHDLYWRHSMLSHLKNYEWLEPTLSTVFSFDMVQQLDQLIQKVVLDVGVGIRLQLGTEVAVLCCDGTYTPAAITDESMTYGKNCIYTATDDRFASVMVNTWICRLQRTMHDIPCHQCQIRPVLRTIVDVIGMVHDGFTDEQQQLMRDCRLVRRGCEVKTADGETHLVVVNDLELLLFVDTSCRAFNYFRVVSVGANVTTLPEDFSLNTFARKFLWIAPSLEPFGRVTGNGNAGEMGRSVSSGEGVSGMATESDESCLRAQEQNNKTFKQCGEILEAALAKCDGLLVAGRKELMMSALDHSLLVTDVTQGEAILASLGSFADLLKESREQRKLMVDEYIEVKTSLTAILNEIQTAGESTKVRMNQLWAMRQQFHTEISTSVVSLKNDFVAIGRNMEEALSDRYDSDTVYRAIQAVSELKALVNLRDATEMSSDDVVAEARAILQQFHIWEELPAESFVDMGLSDRNETVTPLIPAGESLQMEVDEGDGSVKGSIGDGGECSSAEVKANSADEFSIPLTSVSGALVLCSSTGAASLAQVLSTSETSATTDTAAVVVDTSSNLGGITELPIETYDERQPSMAMRRWGRSLAVEYCFSDDVFNVTADQVTAAGVLVGSALPNNSTEFEWFQHIRLYCNYIINVSLPTFGRAGILLIPAPDPSAVETVTSLLAKQPLPLRSALKHYLQQYNPPDTDEVLQGMLSYVRVQRNGFDSTVKKLKKKVADPSLVKHLL